MLPMYYIGLDVHKRKISYCVKDGSGRVHAEGSIPPHVWTWITGCDRSRSRGARRWKRPETHLSTSALVVHLDSLVSLIMLPPGGRVSHRPRAARKSRSTDRRGR
jgi:hypothetical protein